jgi:hypothetical protein
MRQLQRLELIVGSLLIGFGVAAYLFFAGTFIWMSHAFILGFSSTVHGWIFLLFPAAALLFGIYLMRNARKPR